MNMNFNLTAMIKPETEEVIVVFKEALYELAILQSHLEVLLEVCAKDTK